jgi:uncharacterized membrane protein YjfL (UPF0719 family)
MFTARLLLSLCEFVFLVVMSGLVVVLTYRIFVKANPDFHMGAEIAKGNTAVGTLMAAILGSASYILMAGTETSIGMFRMHMLAPSGESDTAARILCLIIAHLGVSMLLAVVSISVTLRLFGRLEPELHAGKELQKGNMAVGILLSAVVVISAAFVHDGVSALSKSLVPRTAIGRILTAK